MSIGRRLVSLVRLAVGALCFVGVWVFVLILPGALIEGEPPVALVAIAAPGVFLWLGVLLTSTRFRTAFGVVCFLYGAFGLYWTLAILFEHGYRALLFALLPATITLALFAGGYLLTRRGAARSDHPVDRQ